MSKVQEAILTGESVDASGATLYRMTCPACQGPQWHGHGHSTCIYCDQPFVIHKFKVIPGIAPEEKQNE